MAESQLLSDIDANFGATKLHGEWDWYPASQLGIFGKAWPTPDSPFDRLPAKFQPKVRNPVWQLSQHSAGIHIGFHTDASAIAARWTLKFESSLAEQMPATSIAGLDLYSRHEHEWAWCGTGLFKAFPFNESVLIEGMSHAAREFRLYLPIYGGIKTLEIGVSKNSTISSSGPSDKKPICVYGTSIVQGACASRPGLSYPAILGRMADAEVINMGFSGNAHMEPEIAQLLSEIDASIFLIDTLPNMSAEWVAERYTPFVKTLANERPQAQFMLVEQCPYQNAWLLPQRAAEIRTKNEALRGACEILKAAFPGRIHYLPTGSILDSGDCSTDGLHLNDRGFILFAQALYDCINKMKS